MVNESIPPVKSTITMSSGGFANTALKLSRTVSFWEAGGCTRSRVFATVNHSSAVAAVAKITMAQRKPAASVSNRPTRGSMPTETTYPPANAQPMRTVVSMVRSWWSAVMEAVSAE